MIIEKTDEAGRARFEARMGGRVALVRQIGNHVVPALREPEPSRQPEKAAKSVAEEVAEIAREVEKAREGLKQMETTQKGIKETDAQNRAKWATDTLAQIITAGLAAIRQYQASCLDAARRTLETPAVMKLAEDYERFSGTTLTANALARLLADAAEAADAAAPTEAEQACKSMAEGIELLDEAWSQAEGLLKAAGKPIARVYEAYDRAQSAIASGTISPMLGAAGLLQIAVSEFD
jgi:hypothetical protein